MHTVHAQAANLFHPWHQHWAETICCQQLSLLAQTLGSVRVKKNEKKLTPSKIDFLS